jgi:hypothetical protein
MSTPPPAPTSLLRNSQGPGASQVGMVEPFFDLMRRNFQRILAWLVLAGALWIAGALASPEQRLSWWTVALLIELVSPALYFWAPGLGRSTLADWDIVTLPADESKAPR